VEKKRTTIITSETHEVLIFRRPTAGSIRAWCAGCTAEAEMLTPEEAGLMARVSTRTIYCWAEAGKVHFAETPDGLLHICQQSMTERLAIPPPQLTTGEI